MKGKTAWGQPEPHFLSQPLAPTCAVGSSSPPPQTTGDSVVGVPGWWVGVLVM